jgi:hypothetical protein
MTLYTKRNNNYGVNTNVELDPSAVASSSPTVNNKIIIEAPRSERASSTDVEYPPASSPPEVTPEILTRSPYLTLPTENIETVEEKLLKIYSDILLSQNKTLLTNILSKSAIILTKSDLESIISTKIGRNCSIMIAEEKVGCLARANILHKVEQILIVLDDTNVDFQYVYNSDYRLLQDHYHLSMKYVC